MKIGLVYAISFAASEACKAEIQRQLIAQGLTPDIVTHEVSRDRYEAARGNAEQTAVLLLESIQKLYQQGARLFAICANSVHIGFEHVCEQLPAAMKNNIQLLSMIDETANICVESGLSEAVVLASNSTINSGLYATPLAKKGITVLPLDEASQDFVHRLIQNGVTKEAVSDADISTMNTIVAKRPVIFGCAELADVFNPENLNTAIIDSRTVLINRLCQIVLDDEKAAS